MIILPGLRADTRQYNGLSRASHFARRETLSFSIRHRWKRYATGRHESPGNISGALISLFAISRLIAHIFTLRLRRH
jgi:hypothetical protein